MWMGCPNGAVALRSWPHVQRVMTPAPGYCGSQARGWMAGAGAAGRCAGATALMRGQQASIASVERALRARRPCVGVAVQLQGIPFAFCARLLCALACVSCVLCGAQEQQCVCALWPLLCGYFEFYF